MKTGAGTGFVLRTWPLREADLIVSAYTLEHGRIRGVARAATRPRSRWAGALDAMVEVSFEWREKEGEELLSLTDGSIVRSPYRVARDLGTSWTLAAIAELVDVTAPPNDPDETAYRLLRAAVDALLGGTPPLLVARYVESWVLRLHGVLPDMIACVRCERPLTEGGTWHWSLHGLACPSCLREEVGGVAVMPEDLALLDEMRRRGPASIATPHPRVLRRVTMLLRQLLRELIGRPLKSEPFLDDLERLERK